MCFMRKTNRSGIKGKGEGAYLDKYVGQHHWLHVDSRGFELTEEKEFALKGWVMEDDGNFAGNIFANVLEMFGKP